MILILDLWPDSDLGKNLESLFLKQFPGEVLKRLGSLADFQESLKSNFYDISVLLIVVNDQGGLQALETVQDSLRDLQSIFLTDTQEHTNLKRIHSFYPRYVQDVDADLSETVAVVLNLIKKNESFAALAEEENLHTMSSSISS